MGGNWVFYYLKCYDHKSGLFPLWEREGQERERRKEKGRKQGREKEERAKVGRERKGEGEDRRRGARMRRRQGGREGGLLPEADDCA